MTLGAVAQHNKKADERNTVGFLAANLIPTSTVN
jgi:hypothetical protein